MKPEYIAYGIHVYMLIGFLLWLWAIVDDAATGKRHGLIMTIATLVAMLLGWPFLVVGLTKSRRRQ